MHKGTPQKRWEQLERETVYRARIFDVVQQTSRSPRSGASHQFSLIQSCDWVNIIPITEAGEVIFVRQFRHGIEDFTLEIPGGMMDPDDSSARAAALRELVEETGYRADDVISLGSIDPNPAIQGNRCHTFLARGVVLSAKPQLDSTEDCEVVRIPLSDVPQLIREGTITHALVVVAFYWLELHRSTLLAAEP